MSEWVSQSMSHCSESVTRSPIELLLTAKNTDTALMFFTNPTFQEHKEKKSNHLIFDFWPLATRVLAGDQYFQFCWVAPNSISFGNCGRDFATSKRAATCWCSYTSSWGRKAVSKSTTIGFRAILSSRFFTKPTCQPFVSFLIQFVCADTFLYTF